MDQLETPSARSKNERRHFTYQNFIFAGISPEISFGEDTLRQDLRAGMIREMHGALAS
jgi:hypothetical protein